MKRIVMICLIFVGLQSYGAMTCTPTNLTHNTQAGSVRHGVLYTCAWTSSGGGAASDTVTLRGILLKVETVPGSGADAPDDNYDLTMPCTRTGAADGLRAQLENRDTANTETVPGAGSGISIIGYFNDTCTVTIAAAGSANTGTVYLTLVNP